MTQSKDGKWRVEGYDTFSREYYDFGVECTTEAEALGLAKEAWDQFTGDEELRDSIFIFPPAHSGRPPFLYSPNEKESDK